MRATAASMSSFRETSAEMPRRADPVGLCDRRRLLFHARLVPRNDRDVHSFGGKRMGHGEAYPDTAARDHGPLSLQLEVHPHAPFAVLCFRVPC